MSNLVIVESPAKAKTIKSFLGKDFEVLASMGHVRDLPKSSMGVNLRRNFTPLYLTIDGKEKIVKDLKKAAKKSDKVFLATDPDREGEAISWHLAHILDLDQDENNRVIFEEITKKGITEGMSNPRNINMDLVNSQQARRILDRIVGYQLSPFLWKKIRRGLSAGRVQSVAVRLIVDRELEIESFIPEEYWQLTAYLKIESEDRVFTAKLRTKTGTPIKDFKIPDESKCDEIIKDIGEADFEIVDKKKRKRRRTPEPPFITSTLQQDASRRFGFSARRTMKAAQELYEGVPVEGKGTMGLITYMRTDSIRVSDSANDEAKRFIEENFGNKYYCKVTRDFKQKRKVAAQDAHEAIRPTEVFIEPSLTEKTLTRDQQRIYKIIWERFIASRMSDQVFDTETVDIRAGNYMFRATGSRVLFDGFSKLYEVATEEKKEDENLLPVMSVGDKLIKKELKPSQHFTQPSPRYTEASLIKALEENGIGRPSTYAPTISTIIERGYVERQQKNIIPTQLGRIVTELMKEQFSDIVDVKFSASMEENLDRIEEGKEDWVQVLSEFYNGFEKSLKNAEENMKDKKIEIPDEVSDVVCELCGRNMLVKSGRYGKFLACPGFPECKNTKKLVEETEGQCPKCGKKIHKKRSSKGRIYFGCEDVKGCGFMTWNQPTSSNCPKCNSTLFLKRGKTPLLYCQKEGCGYSENAV